MSVPSTPTLLLTLGLCGLLTGCLGNPEPYRPGWEPRPEPIPVETEEARAKRMAVPVEILRNDAYLLQAKKEVARVMGDIPRQPWNAERVDMVAVLGEDIARPYLPNDPRGGAAPAEAAEEGGDEEGGDEEGGGVFGDEGGGDDW